MSQLVHAMQIHECAVAVPEILSDVRRATGRAGCRHLPGGSPGFCGRHHGPTSES